MVWLLIYEEQITRLAIERAIFLKSPEEETMEGFYTMRLSLHIKAGN